jgi:hypothetical protein
MTMSLRHFLILCLMSFAAIGRASATTVLPLTLDDIVGNAAIAFQGTCTENRSEQDSQTNLVVTYTTFAVHDVLKGKPGETYTIKQVGGEIPGREIAFKVHGVPTFTPGEEYLVFLPPPSSAGFSSPVGLSQGRFTVAGQAANREIANGRDFREMTANISDADLTDDMAQNVKHSASPVRHMGIEQFKQLVRDRAGKQR